MVTAATGTLRPAVDNLLARGDTVFALTRHARRLPSRPGLVPVVSDWNDHAALRAALAGLSAPEAALVYAPTAGDGTAALLAGRVTGRLVEILTSRWAEPGDDAEASVDPGTLASAGVVLLLGWKREPGGCSRWHNPQEISRAALEVLATGRPTVLGEVRPWADRP